MKKIVLTILALLPLSLLICGCEVGSGDDFVRTVDVDFSGRYDATSEADSQFVSPANSGKRVTSLNLRQTGDQLEAIDNNSLVFSGSIGNISDATASFILEGVTTANQPVTINGTLTGEGTTAVMSGTWVEPGLFAYINGDATINPIPTNPTLSVSGSASMSVNSSQTLTAAGGTGNYQWSLSSTIGTLNPNTGASVTYAATQTGSQTVTVNDGNTSATLTITQGGSTTNSLSVSPSSATVNADGSQVFTASNGSGGYTWSLNNGDKGKLSSANSNPTTYTRLAAGDNTITVTDSSGNSKTASIFQP
ncbi:MAG TPA: hypothetical protein DCZ95_10205 [Verrucomicrobia bacterium]|nr:MAG: hypothetical protein A2X46_08190 [Lentisphaerae bacterium GWF2_57_35]HBA84454.1 hypothetical protein [Verrucomicrobiota bacterium]